MYRETDLLLNSTERIENMRILTNVSQTELDYLANQPTAKAMIEKVKTEGAYVAEGDMQGAADFVANRNSKNGNVENYYSYLQKNYNCLSKGNVTISSEYLKKCAGDSSKAKELENFLKQIPELEKQGYEELCARNKALGGNVTYYQQSWMINKDGSVQSTVYSVTETEMTNAERMKKNMDERLEKQKEKREEEKKINEQKEEKQEKKETDMKASDGDSISSTKSYSVKYVEVQSKEEANFMMQNEKMKDAYYSKFDVSV